jgi:hypothetical protein
VTGPIIQAPGERLLAFTKPERDAIVQALKVAQSNTDAAKPVWDQWEEQRVRLSLLTFPDAPAPTPTES